MPSLYTSVQDRHSVPSLYKFHVEHQPFILAKNKVEGEAFKGNQFMERCSKIRTAPPSVTLGNDKVTEEIKVLYGEFSGE